MIDTTEFSILTAIERSQTPLWKKEIHRRVLDNTDSIPGLDSISIQTISRRVQDLYDDQHLSARLTNTDQVNRTLITTYQLTSKGQAALDSFRETFLKDWALGRLRTRLTDETAPPETDPTAVQHIFCDHYDIPRNAFSGCPLDHIHRVLTDHFLDHELDDTVDHSDHPDVTATLQQHSPELLTDSDKT